MYSYTPANANDVPALVMNSAGRAQKGDFSFISPAPTNEIDKIISNVPYDNTSQTKNNPITDYSNKYWDKDQIDTLTQNLYKISQNIPAELNFGLIGNQDVYTPSADNGEIILNGYNQYYEGIYTIPENTNQINLNNDDTLLKIKN